MGGVRALDFSHCRFRRSLVFNYHRPLNKWRFLSHWVIQSVLLSLVASLLQCKSLKVVTPTFSQCWIQSLWHHQFASIYVLFILPQGLAIPESFCAYFTRELFYSQIHVLVIRLGYSGTRLKLRRRVIHPKQLSGPWIHSILG